MTDHLTTSQLLARYDAQQRQLAASAGGPTDRTACPGIIPGGHVGSVIYTGSDNRLQIMGLRDQSLPSRLTRQALRRAIVDAYDLADPSAGLHVVTVFADTESLRSAVKMAEWWVRDSDTQEASQTHRLLTYRANLPTSTYLPVLTEALASRYWMPAGASLDNLTSWDAAFDHRHETHGRAAFSYLIGRALDGVDESEIMKSMRASEKFGSRAAQAASTFAACSAFTQADSFTDAYSGLLSIDRTLRERNVLAGVVSKIRVHQVLSNRIEAYVENPGRLREGSKVYVFDDHETGGHATLTLNSVEFHNDTLMVVLSTPSARSGKSHLIEEAKKSHRPLFVAAAPFLMVKRAPKNRRWTAGGEDKSLHVDIPVDIALAGGPSDG